jgi:hypothetical protein
MGTMEVSCSSSPGSLTLLPYWKCRSRGLTVRLEDSKGNKRRLYLCGGWPLCANWSTNALSRVADNLAKNSEDCHWLLFTKVESVPTARELAWRLGKTGPAFDIERGETFVYIKIA